MSRRASDVVVVGASIGGITVAETLRTFGHVGAITVIGEEAHAPYNRPPLSKQVLTGQWTPEDAVIVAPDRLAELGIDLITGRRATGLDVRSRLVRLDHGDVMTYDRLVVATGVRPRRLAAEHQLSGVHTLRTWDDAVGIQRDSATAHGVLVVGAGVLGSEIAAGMVKRGLAVTLVGRGSDLHFGHLGARLSPVLQTMHRAHGVDIRLGVDVLDLVGEERVRGAVLSDGSRVDADLVIVAIGSRPATDWLSDALPLADGILCDADGEAVPGVYAVGDVARWRYRGGAKSTRIEHQQNAIEQAQRVGELIGTGARNPQPIKPFFWSELYGNRVQVYGDVGTDALRVVVGDIADNRFVALAEHDGRAVGVVGWNLPRDFREARALIDQVAPSASTATHDKELIS